jgi:nucleoside-diphosphate-sugar epimerase
MLVFVTGGTGFIGSCTISHLLARGHRVLGLTRSENRFGCARETRSHTASGLAAGLGESAKRRVPSRCRSALGF